MDRALRRYYVAVSQPTAKLGTLMELLAAIQADQDQARLPGPAPAAAICCSSRDSMDAVTSALLDAPEQFTVFVLHSDMSDRDRDAQLALLKRAVGCAPEPPAPGSPPADAGQDATTSGIQPKTTARDAQAGAQLGNSGSSSTVVLVATDVCLKAIPKELLPLGLPLLVQFDLARQKEAYQRRVSTVCGSGKERRNAAGPSIVIDFVSAGEVATFRTSESWFTGTILEMPVQVAEIFQAA